MSLIQPPKNNSSFYVYRMDRCQNCGNQALELYDFFNNPQGYRTIVDLIVANKRMPAALFNKRPFYTFRCKQCGKTYPILWLSGFPVPDFGPSYIGEFMSQFRDLNQKKGKGK